MIRIVKISTELTDEIVLEELGRRLAGVRLGRNLTQAALAHQAGVSKRTVERLESGAVAIQLTSLLRVCRTLGLLERFENLIPAPTTSPMQQLKQQGRRRKRASGGKATSEKNKTWTWGDES